MKFPESILIARTDRIGDVVLSLPVAAVIKKHSPSTRVAFLLSNYTRPLAEGNPYIDEIISLSGKNGKPRLLRNIKQLKKGWLFSGSRFGASIAAYPTFKIALILFLSGVGIRIGTAYRWYSFLFNRKIRDHRKFGERHELEFNIRLLRKLGIEEKINEKNALFGITPAPGIPEKVRTGLILLGISFSKPIVIVHPGSGGSSIDLPAGKLKRVLKLISGEEIDIIISGTRSEKELCSSLVVNKNIINRAGEYDLQELIALINMGDVIIANSTGPIHIAAALGKYVIGFYPKIAACSAQRWGPYTEKKLIFNPEIECSGCTRAQCARLNCMESISEDAIAAGIIKTLHKLESEKRS